LTKLGPYEIVGRSARVAWARCIEQKKLGREVAIRVVSNALARDPERRARFEPEAEVPGIQNADAFDGKRNG
jgi:hypothetical protein